MRDLLKPKVKWIDNVLVIGMSVIIICSMMYGFGYFRGKNSEILNSEYQPCNCWQSDEE